MTATAALADGGATEVEMTAAQAAWINTRVPWESGEGHIFGPIDALNTDPHLDSWPLATSDLATFVSSGSTVANILSAGDDVQGFHAIEYLLFGDGIADNEKTAAELTTAEAEYVKNLGEVFKQRTAELVNAWTTEYSLNGVDNGPFIDHLQNPGSDKIYTGDVGVVEELVNGMIGIVDEVGNGKIADPFNESDEATAKTLVESQYSWNSLTDFHNNIQSVRAIYTGLAAADGTSVGSNGIYDFVLAHDSTLATRVLDEINAAMDAIALIDGDGDTTTTNIASAAQTPFRDAISDTDGRALIQTAVDALSTLQISLEEDVLTLISQTDFAS